MAVRINRHEGRLLSESVAARADAMPWDGIWIGALKSQLAGFRPAPVSTLPAGSDGTATLNEDGVYTFHAADFGFSDADGHTLAAVRVVSTPALGRLVLGANTVQVGQLITAFDLAGNLFTFHPWPDENGTPYASFTFRVQDSNNEEDASANTLTLNVNAVNDAPVFRGLEGTIVRASVDSAGNESADAGSDEPDISFDGNLVVFANGGPFLAGDTNNASDIYLKNLATGELTRISTTSAGGQATLGDSTDPVFSPDGTKVMFASYAGNLVAADSNGARDIFIKDLATGAITRVSTYANGQQATSSSSNAIFSPDGASIMFRSGESFTGQGGGIFVKDLATGTLTMVSTRSDGSTIQLSTIEASVAFSPDGTRIAFASTSIIPGSGSTNQMNVFVKDLATGVVTNVSTDSAGNEGNSASHAPVFSADGTKVAFYSIANNLVSGDTNGGADIFIKDLVTGATTRVSTDSMGGQLSGIGPLSFSPDGTRILFFRNGDIHIKNLVTGELTTLEALVSTSEDDWTHDMRSAAFGADGHSILFTTFSLNVVPDDSNLEVDVFVAQLIEAPVYNAGGPAAQVAEVVAVSDIDSANFAGGSLAVAIGAGLMADDRLSIATSSTPGSGVEISGANVRFNGTIVGTIAATATSFTISLNANSSAAAVEAIAEAVRIDSSSPTPPDGVRTVSFTLNDGDGIALGGDDSTSFTRDVLFDSGSDQPADARDDAFSTTEIGIVTGSVFVDNGSGADSDPDGPPLAVATVNGSAANVGVEFNLPSGALLRLNADGSFSYNPNGQFQATPLPSTGASNTPAPDSFTYTLAGGDAATVHFTIAGLNGDDLIRGTPGSDVLVSDFGRDTLEGLGGNDFLFVRSDDVVIETSGGGFDNVLARTSFTLNAGAWVEVLSTDNHGGTAARNLTGNALSQVIIGNAGVNVLDGGGGADRLAGLGGDDFLYVDSMDDYVEEAAGGGYDNVLAGASYVLTAGAYAEILSTSSHGGTGAINLTGNALANIVIGNAGGNILDGGGGADRLAGLGGNDFLIVDSMDDFVDEEVNGGYDNLCVRASYTLFGASEIEVISTDNHGGTASIDITGSAFNQVIIGNAGNNVLDGSFGQDRLAGLGGADSYAFSTNLSSFNIDTIDGFDADDTILLENAIFTGLAAGALNANAFVNGTAAADADDRIIYDAATGRLFFDADGTGSGNMLHFATLENHFALTASDFAVI